MQTLTPNFRRMLFMNEGCNGQESNSNLRNTEMRIIRSTNGIWRLTINKMRVNHVIGAEKHIVSCWHTKCKHICFSLEIAISEIAGGKKEY